LVECAVLFPVFVLIVLGGVIDAGTAVYNLASLQMLACETARLGATQDGNTLRSKEEIIAHAQGQKPSWWTGTYTVRGIEHLSIGKGHPQVVRVTLTYDSPIITPFVQGLGILIIGSLAIPMEVEATCAIHAGPPQ
jgi:Flp pilus assembly protein TadG